MNTKAVVEQPGRLPTRLANAIGGVDANDDLAQGVGGGFSVVSFRGSKWRVKHGGEETLITNTETQEAVPSIQVVLLRANRAVSKNFYEGKYVEGSTDNPTCWSVDGVKPDAAVPVPVNPVCASCPKNVFGSRMTDDGRKAKACGDSRRLAVVPANDLANEAYGGPMLLRVPAASLGDLAQYGKVMKAKGFPYNTVVTRVGFDNDVSYPKLVFKPVRPINEEEENTLIELLSDAEFSSKIESVLAFASEVTTAPAAGAPIAPPPPAPAVAAPTASAPPPPPPPPPDPFAFEQPAPVASKPKAAAADKKPAKPAPSKPAPAAPPPPLAASTAVDETDLDDEINAVLAKLDNME
jgi:hypothetical protein